MTLLILSVLILIVSACSSLTKGVVQALMSDEEKLDDRQCWIRGRPFYGLESMIADHNDTADTKHHSVQLTIQPTVSKTVPLKILKVHGIGSHQPGYANRLFENLVRVLDFPVVEETIKTIDLAHPQYPEGLGVLQIHRYFDQSQQRELIFYELTWDAIVESEKQTLAFDNSTQVSDKRTGFNHMMKTFVNDTMPDALMYNSWLREPIQMSVAQAMCWMLSETWEGLPRSGRAHCDLNRTDFWSQAQQDIAIISHSLGSRIVIDALQAAAERIVDDPAESAIAKKLQDTKINLYMLSNQLPLLQLGQEIPQVTNQINAICDKNSPRYAERFFEKLQIVAFSDPNDLFSYTIPPNYINQKIDSRLCPRLTNVVINIAHVSNLFGLQELANPLKAHTEYEADSRVIALLVGGFGTGMAHKEPQQRCSFIEAVSNETVRGVMSNYKPSITPAENKSA